MARTRLSIEEKIAKAKDKVEKTKEKHEAAVRELNKLMEKTGASKQPELVKVLENDLGDYDEEEDEDDDFEDDFDFFSHREVVTAVDLKSAYEVLNEMMDNFEDWFPMKPTDTEEDLVSYKNRFAGTKLCLEVGEYTGDDYDYLHYLQGVVSKYPRYYQAIRTFINALSREYRW